MDLKTVFEERKNDSIWNTSYPISPDDWRAFRIENSSLSFADEPELSFYVHIPFCKQLCSFCEYTRMLCPKPPVQLQYLQTLQDDIKTFLKLHNNFILRGFDIGGGTPTALSEENFSFLLDIYDDSISHLRMSDDYEASLEGTFSTVTAAKISRMKKSNIHRLSLGVQSTCEDVLNLSHREQITPQIMRDKMELAWELGVKKINLDLMYGLRGQDESTIAHDIKTMELLRPQQITLYELRTNMIRQKDVPSKEKLYQNYLSYFRGLRALGYHAKFGQNTFTLNPYDEGVSSYLRSRMLDGIAYKGFGISAQSMNSKGVAYNIGKNRNKLAEIVNRSSYNEEYTYCLPPEELAAKYIAIAAYNGSFSLRRVSQLLGVDAFEYFHDELDFVLSRNLMSFDSSDRIRITETGFYHYGALFSLFTTPLRTKENETE